jgi:hypothetical protein
LDEDGRKKREASDEMGQVAHCFLLAAVRQT